jgi:hypothetical protein
MARPDRPAPLVHPSDVGGATSEYREFLATWARHCGAPASVFQGHLNALLQAELRAAGTDVLAAARELAERNAVYWRAIDRLTRDLIAFLGSHDCVEAGHVGEGCPDGAKLLDRLATARRVLGLGAPPP